MYKEKHLLEMPYGCDLLGTYAPLECGTDKFYYNKVVAIGIIQNPAKDFGLPATYDYPDLASISQDIIVIDNAKGEYDGGEPEVSTEAYGSKLEQVIGRKHSLTFEVEYNPKNWEFFDGLSSSKNYGLVFLTGEFEELNYSGRVDVTFSVKTTVSRERGQVRSYFATVTWSNMKLAQPVDVSQAIRDLFR